ncbi:MAG: carboxymuconolactone decarboxylase family protein [Acidobacteriota bacterium]|nr:carboxymuconolactone decarboxylase family protein [Blastocatellia bacterium]MDW8412813.1 carboxymuconolactone decarboxylase family protein [Acidobacteriota bacterium]
MGIDKIKDSLGEFAKDIKLNLSSVLTEEGAPDLKQHQIYGIALSCAYATKNPELVKALEEDVGEKLTPQEVKAAKAAATLMAMNNVYYRFVHLVGDAEFSKMPARLRMNFIGNPGIPKVDFELYSLAVSAINGCGKCIEAHSRIVQEQGLSKTAVQSAVRIAAVINATAQALSTK